MITIMKSRRMRLAGYVARRAMIRNVDKILVGKSGGKRPVGRLSHRWEVNIGIDLIEIG
jgi:hypothetical protein